MIIVIVSYVLYLCYGGGGGGVENKKLENTQ